MSESDTEQTFIERIRGELAARGLSARSAALRAGLPIRSVQGVLEGHSPSLARAGEIAKALGMKFYIGPPAPSDKSVLKAVVTQKDGLSAAQLGNLEVHTQGLVRLTVETGGNPIPDDLRTVLLGPDEVAEPGAVYDPVPSSNVVNLPGARPVDVRELSAAAGGGAETFDEKVAGCVWFRSDWLNANGLDPTQCVVIGVRGESMEPVLPSGCSILVDRAHRRRRAGHIFVLRTADGVVVKRLERTPDGWLLASEHPAWSPIAWSDEIELIGTVRWVARTLG